MENLEDLEILNALESGSSPTHDEYIQNRGWVPLQPAKNDEENGATSRPTGMPTSSSIISNHHQVLQTGAGSEYEYLILTEVNDVTVEVIENNEVNNIVVFPEFEDNVNVGELDKEIGNVEVMIAANEVGLGVNNEMELIDEIIDSPSRDGLSDEVNIDDLPQPKITRKRLFRPDTWKRNIRKKHHQAGLEYINEKGKTVPKKVLLSKKDCLKCKYKCSKNITENERLSLFNGYYGLKSKNEKQFFIVNNTERLIKNRDTTKNVEEPSRRKFTFKYFFIVKGAKVQVCQSYFLGTIQISQKTVYNVHLHKNDDTGLPKSDGRGVKKSTGIPTSLKDDVRKHIKSFPVVESHYCRADSNKLYLDSTLNIRKMFELFKEKHPNHVVKESMYRHIFNSEFNLDFHVPKKDRCDLCEEHEVAVKEKIPFDPNKYTAHIVAKTAMRSERKADRESNGSVLSFDLQNVISCPRAEISSFFYYSKLSIYNLTAHLKTPNEKIVYCAIWPETMGGRSGNDIASAMYKILSKVLEDNPLMETLTTWSDSCVPQNRNQMMSGAMMEILKKHPTLKSISMKYSTPGHGAVQDVDNIHSQIEKAFSTSEYYSPVSMVRILLKVNKKNPFRVIQMMSKDFLDFAESSKDFNFVEVPFTKVSCLTFTQVVGEVKYTEVHGGDNITINLKSSVQTATRAERSKRAKSGKTNSEPRANQTPPVYKTPRTTKKIQQLSTLKVKHLKEMERFMPLLDREYFKAILKSN